MFLKIISFTAPCRGLSYRHLNTCNVLLVLQPQHQNTQDDGILEQMVSLNGLMLFPTDVLARGRFNDKYFDKSGKLRGYVLASSVRELLDTRFPLQPEDEPGVFASLLSRMLRLRPEDRELLKHPWLRDV
ncbi:hypothetical protein EV421DRAFT_1396394 [Armillaria borealis]|uniref:Uncharacterized protein n=1 Tax=Armillaria borealis TaxID=47425 RepID=A0AA39JUJ3_9AGAR|nr:hypothetical protein EV421DRAFT_1396394 [Armillaria borealis]